MAKHTVVKFFDLDQTQRAGHISFSPPDSLYDNKTDEHPSAVKVKEQLKIGLEGAISFDSRNGSVFAGVTYNPNPREWLAFQIAMLGDGYKIEERMHHDWRGRETVEKSAAKVIMLLSGGIFLMRKYTVFKNGIEDPVPLILMHPPGCDYFDKTLTPKQTRGRDNIGTRKEKSGYLNNLNRIISDGKNTMLQVGLSYLRKKIGGRINPVLYDDSEGIVKHASEHKVLGPRGRYFIVDANSAQFRAQEKIVSKNHRCFDFSFDSEHDYFNINGDNITPAVDLNALTPAASAEEIASAKQTNANDSGLGASPAQTVCELSVDSASALPLPLSLLGGSRPASAGLFGLITPAPTRTPTPANPQRTFSVV